MRLRQLDGAELTAKLGRAHPQLGLQMFPLVEQLSPGLRNAALESPARNLGGIKSIAAIGGLVCKADEK
jgi:hypothetical protein